MKNGRIVLSLTAAFVVFGMCAAQAAHKDVKHCANDYKIFVINGDSRLRVSRTACVSMVTS